MKKNEAVEERDKLFVRLCDADDTENFGIACIKYTNVAHRMLSLIDKLIDKDMQVEDEEGLECPICSGDFPIKDIYKSNDNQFSCWLNSKGEMELVIVVDGKTAVNTTHKDSYWNSPIRVAHCLRCGKKLNELR